VRFRDAAVEGMQKPPGEQLDRIVGGSRRIELRRGTYQDRQPAQQAAQVA
jgi:hypothetical protein